MYNVPPTAHPRAACSHCTCSCLSQNLELITEEHFIPPCKLTYLTDLPGFSIPYDWYCCQPQQQCSRSCIHYAACTTSHSYLLSDMPHTSESRVAVQQSNAILSYRALALRFEVTRAHTVMCILALHHRCASDGLIVYSVAAQERFWGDIEWLPTALSSSQPSISATCIERRARAYRGLCPPHADTAHQPTCSDI